MNLKLSKAYMGGKILSFWGSQNVLLGEALGSKNNTLAS